MNILKRIKNLFNRKKDNTMEESTNDFFHCVIKLVSGEEIVALIMHDDNDGDPVIVLQNPVIINFIRNKNKLSIKVRPWIETSTDDLYIIKPSNVITMTETVDLNIIGIYERFVSMESSDSVYEDYRSGRVKPSERMGYISSVEDARKKLEDIFKGL